jgi:hypothetical protein
MLISNLINIARHNSSDITLDIIQSALVPYLFTEVKKSNSKDIEILILY